MVNTKYSQVDDRKGERGLTINDFSVLIGLSRFDSWPFVYFLTTLFIHFKFSLYKNGLKEYALC